MFYIGLKGGLGNQLFQYAFYIEIKKFYPIVLDDTWFKLRKKNITLSEIIKDLKFTNDNVFKLADLKLSIISRIRKHFFKKKTHIIENQKTLFDFNSLDKESDYYLDGYWQSYKYFEKSLEEIKEIYFPKEKYKSLQQILKGKCNNKQLCSVHIRRGDYANDKIMHCLSMKYYENAMSSYIKENPESVIIVFSDDIPFCKENLQERNNLIFCDWNKSALDDLYSMAVCDDHILSNSTFSYWGALLSRENGKVIYPSKWFGFADSKDVSFMFPDEWICQESV